MIDFNEVKFNCKYFRGDVPCLPNKLRGKICSNCDEYNVISKRILVIKLGAIGDVIRTTPLTVRFKNIYQNCHITWVTCSPEVLSENHIDEICSFDSRTELKLKGIHFDIAVNLDKDKEACILLSNVSAGRKYGFIWKDSHIDGMNEAAKRKLLTGIFDELSKCNTKSYQQEIFEICDLVYEGEPLLVEVDKRFYEKWFVVRKIAGRKKIVGLNTGCGKRWPTRLWPQEYWVSLVKLLQDKNYFPILLGGPDEDEKNRFYSSETGTYYPGILILKEFIALTAHCDIVISAVTMMMNIAVGLEKPLILFNNIFNKNEFELYGRGEIIEPETGCDCYYGSSCSRKKPCMNDIPPLRVLNSVKRIL